MLPLLAQFHTAPTARDAREKARRTLQLPLSRTSLADAHRVLIHNLSETGLMIETTARLEPGEEFQVELPEAGLTTARVVWTEGYRAGCEFLPAISKAAVSAALLLSPFPQSETESGQAIAAPKPLLDIDAQNWRPLVSRERTASIIGLAMLLGMAAIFIIAMLSFPFSGA